LRQAERVFYFPACIFGVDNPAKVLF